MLSPVLLLFLVYPSLSIESTFRLPCVYGGRRCYIFSALMRLPDAGLGNDDSRLERFPTTPETRPTMCCRHSRTFSETTIDLGAEGEAKGRRGQQLLGALPRGKEYSGGVATISLAHTWWRYQCHHGSEIAMNHSTTPRQSPTDGAATGVDRQDRCLIIHFARIRR
ncbi:hypothetical protein BDZ89DRAFT_709629 [Hymenopellis radicata]|nr:hypothetical protein BDZ89DRAFT_709629 [Hymenopellis radicata]